MDEIRALQKQLYDVQQGKSVHKLTERNVVELVSKLVDKKLVTLHLSGQGYITPAQVDEEVKDELMVANGRISLSSLQEVIHTDSTYIKQSVARIVDAEPHKYTLYEGDLIADYFLDDLCSEINSELQEEGHVSLAEVSSRHNFQTEFLTEEITARLGSLIDGKLGQGGLLYTSAFVRRHTARVRGVLRGVSTPCMLGELRRTFKFKHVRLFEAAVTRVIQDGQVKGQAQIGRGTYTPAVYAQGQDSAVQSFFAQNGFVQYSLLTRLQIRSPEKYLARNYPEGIALDTCFVSQGVLDMLNAAVAEAAHSASWVDAEALLPSICSETDAQIILQRCAAYANGDVLQLDGSGLLLVAKSFIVAARAQFEADALSVVQQAAATAKKKGKAFLQTDSANSHGGFGSEGGGSGGEDDDDGDDDDNAGLRGKTERASRNEQRADKAKKRVAATASRRREDHNDDGDSGSGARRGRKGQRVAKKGGRRGAEDGSHRLRKGEKGKVVKGTASVDTLMPSRETLVDTLRERHPGLEQELASAVIEELYDELARTFAAARRDVFDNDAQMRAKAQKVFDVQFTALHTSLQLHAQGALSLDDGSSAVSRGCAGVLCTHLLRGSAADIVMLLINNQAMLGDVTVGSGDDASSALTRSISDPSKITIPTALRDSTERRKVISLLSPDVRTELYALEASLASNGGCESLRRFCELLVEACRTCTVPVQSLDRKHARQLVFRQRQAIFDSLQAECQPLEALRLAAQLLLLVRHGVAIELPIKAVRKVISLISERSPADTLVEYAELVNTYMLAKHGRTANVEQEQALLRKLEAALPAFVESITAKNT